MDFDFIGGAYEAPSRTQDAQELINYYPEIDPTKPPGSRGVVALYPTPGLVQLVQLAVTGEVRGGRVTPGGDLAYVVCAQTLYEISPSFVATAVGALLTSAGPVTITDNGIALMIADGANRYTYNIGSGPLQVSVDGAFAGATAVDTLDNYMVYAQPNGRKFGATAVLSTASSGLSFASKFGSSDNIVGLIADHTQIYLIGERTSEIWIDAGSFPFPFQRIPGTALQHGCAAVGSLRRFGESIAWLGKDERGQAIFMQLVGHDAKRFSTHAVEQDISAFSRIDDCMCYVYQQEGHEFFVANFPSGDRTWVFDLATGHWHKRCSRDSNNVLHRHRGNCAFLFQGKTVVGDYANGKLYELSRTTFAEDGIVFPSIRRCQHITSDLKQQFFHELQLQFQPGPGLQSGQGSDPKAMLRISEDGGFTFGNTFTASIGRAGEYRNRCRWTQLGSASDLVFEVSVTDPVYRPIVSANLLASAGAH